MLDYYVHISLPKPKLLPLCIGDGELHPNLTNFKLGMNKNNFTPNKILLLKISIVMQYVMFDLEPHHNYSWIVHNI